MLPAIIALIPLVIAPGLLFYFDVTPKIVILLLGVAAALPRFSPGRLMARREGRWLCYLLAFQGASLALSTALSSRVSISIFGANWRRFGLITQLATLLFTALVAADMSGNPGRMRIYLRWIAAVAIPISLYGIGQYFGWDPWLPKEAYHIGEGVWTIVRPPATLGYVSYFANYLVFVVFFGVALYGAEESGWWKRIGAIAATLAVIAIVLSGTRGALLGVLAGAAYLVLRSQGTIGKRSLIVGGGVTALMILFVLSPAGQMLRSRFRWFQEDLLGGARLLLYRDSLKLAGRHPIAGAGLETFSSEFPKVQSEALSRAYPDFYHESPHNILLDTLTAQGILGAVGLVALIGLGFYCARRSAVLGACLLAGLVTHQFTVFTAPTALYFYLVLAMIVALGTEYVPSSRISIYAAAPISIALLLVASRLLAADWELERVKRDLATGDLQSSALRYKRVQNLGLSADVWYSNQMAAQGAWQQAKEAGLRATQTADDPHNAWYSLAALYAREDQFDGVERSLRRSIQSSPTWFKPHWTLARVLMTRGRREEAEKEAQLAASLNAGKNPEVVLTLEQIQAKNK